MDFTLITLPHEFEPLAAGWNSLLSQSISDTPFLRHEYLRSWWETRGGGEWPQAGLAVVTAQANGSLVGAAPLFFASHDSAPALLLLGSIEISDFLDLLARPTDLAPFLHGLLDFLSAPGFPLAWKALDLYNIPENSPSLTALQAEAAARGWNFTRQALQVAPSISLPDNFEAYLASLDKKQRHELRRKMRRAEESERGVRWYIVEDEAALASEVDAFLALMASDPQKAAFLTPAMRTQMHLASLAAFRAGWLQLAFLEIDGQKACAYLNFDYDNKVWVYNSGLDRSFMELSPGWVLLGYLLEWAVTRRRVEFDFMRGSEDYKYKFGASDRQVIRARIMRPLD